MKWKGPFGGGPASGVLGTMVASHNKGGQYLRALAIPTNPRTSRQTAVRNIMASLMVVWSDTLTAAMREAWNLYASNVTVIDRLGDEIYISGVNHFVRSNLPLIQSGGVRVDAGPTTFTLPETDPEYAVTASEATNLLSVSFDDTLAWLDTDLAAMIVYCGRPQSVGVTSFNGPWRIAGSIDGDSVTPPTTPTTIAAPFVLTEGQAVWTYARIVLADGRITNPFRGQAVVAA